MSNELRIGLVLSWASPYVYAVLEGVSEAVQSQRSWVVRMDSVFDLGITRLVEWECDGIIANVTGEELAGDLAALNVPVVNFSGSRAKPRFTTVRIDDRQVGAMAAAHLLNLNLKHFAWWPGHTGAFAVARGKGFFDALRGHGVPPQSLHSAPDTRDAGWRKRDRVLRAWLARLPKPIGLLAAKDSQAYYLADIAREAGLDIPNEIALMGVDNDRLTCSLSVPHLSSIQLPTARVGATAVGLLADLLDGRPAPAEPILFPPTGVVARGSTDMLAIDDPHVAAAVRYIREHAVDRIKVSDVLDRIPLSRRSLEHRFEALFGRTPGAEIRRVQLERAKFLLLNSDAPMPEVARLSGFCDAQYLARVFGEELGMPPSRYRKQHRTP